MYKSLKSLFVTLLIVVLAACAPSTPGEVEDPYLFETRTYYESLDLGTPESAVKTFVEAYEAGDFFTVYLTMTSQAIFSWRVPHMMFEFETLANTEYEEELSDDVIVLNREHRGAWNNFVSFMNSVRDEGALLFDFGNEVNILRTEQIDSTKVFESFWRDSSVVEVYALAEHIPGEVVFTLVQSPEEQWRIHQVSITGGDPDILPWSVPPIDEAVQIPAIPNERRISYVESLNLGSPEAAIETFVDAFHKGDFHTVYLILSPFAQEEWSTHLRRFENENLWKPEFNESATIGGIADFEYFGTWYLFDRLMFKAQEHRALLIDLSGAINILNVKDVETEANKYYGELGVVEVEAIAEFVAGKISFEMLQMPSGDWRVHQVVVPGGDRRIIPWSVPD